MGCLSPRFLWVWFCAPLEDCPTQNQPGFPWRQACLLLPPGFKALSTPMEPGLSFLSMISADMDRASYIYQGPSSLQQDQARQARKLFLQSRTPHPSPPGKEITLLSYDLFLRFPVQPGCWLPVPIHQRCHFAKSRQAVAHVCIFN